MVSQAWRSSRTTFLIIGAAIVLFAGIWLGGHPSWLPAPLRNAFVDDSDGRLVNQVLDVLQRDYYRPVTRSQLLNKGVASLVASLGDPYSHYYDPTAYRAYLSTLPIRPRQSGTTRQLSSLLSFRARQCNAAAGAMRRGAAFEAPA